jgi:hypothetical protein
MQIKRELEVKMSASRRFIIRQLPTDATHGPCAECGEPMVPAEQAANLFGVNQRRIFQLIETGTVHHAEAKTGTTLICVASITGEGDAESSVDTGK